MHRLVISGFACTKDSWIEFLGPGTEVLSLADILDATQTSDMTQWGEYVAQYLKKKKPASIVCHDFGGMALLKAMTTLPVTPWEKSSCLTILNTAFRDFTVLKNPHPILMQLTTWGIAARFIRMNGGTVDPALKPHFKRVKEVYRLVTALSLARRLEKIRKGEGSPVRKIEMQTQIIASGSDPYVSMEAIEGVKRDFAIHDSRKIDYGHFPYASKRKDAVRELIHSLEKKTLSSR